MGKVRYCRGTEGGDAPEISRIFKCGSLRQLSYRCRSRHETSGNYTGLARRIIYISVSLFTGYIFAIYTSEAILKKGIRSATSTTSDHKASSHPIEEWKVH